VNIVLVHGILGFRQKFGIEYFSGVAAHLREKQLRVLVPELDPTQGVEFRSKQLGEQIAAAFASASLDSGQATHLIAHSMGGLDSRFLLSPVNPQRLAIPIRSLTTVSTPHLGSPIADIVDSPEKLAPFPHLPLGPVNLLQDALNALGISLDGLRNLTTASCKAFSARCVNNPQVAYFSTAGSGRPRFPETAAAFLLFHKFIQALTGEVNDGLVTLSSAKWGAFDAQTWAGDHAEEVGHNLDNLLAAPSLQYRAKYDQIVAGLPVDRL
jgi:triacylglycerol lipase